MLSSVHTANHFCPLTFAGSQLSTHIPDDLANEIDLLNKTLTSVAPKTLKH